MGHRIAIGIAVVALGAATAAHGAQRQFVASYGSDAAPCTLTQPCRGFAAAIAAVDPGGEVIVLDSAGYGPVAIAKSVTISAPAGVCAGITVPAGQKGVAVGAGTFDVVLRGVTILGQSAGVAGIEAKNAGSLSVDRCVVEAIAGTGISVSPTAGSVVASIRDTTVSRVNGTGVYLASASGTLERVSVTRVGDAGIYVGQSASVTVTGAVVAYAQNGGIAAGASGGQTTRLSVTWSTISNVVGYGISAADFGGVAIVHATGNTLTSVTSGGLLSQSAGARLIATRNSVADSPWGLVQNVGGTLISFGDNPVYGATAPTTGTITYASWQ